MEKTCGKCGHRRPYSEFTKQSHTSDGLYTYCKVCVRAHNTSYRQRKKSDIAVQRALFRERNREELAAKSRDWARQNPDKVKANCRRYHEANREYRAAYNQAWLAAHKEELRPYYAEKTRRRFAALRNATPPWNDPQKTLAIYEECRRVTLETGVIHHVDHVVPLVSPLVCGLHVHWNLQILPATDNLSKSNKFEG